VVACGASKAVNFLGQVRRVMLGKGMFLFHLMGIRLLSVDKVTAAMQEQCGYSRGVVVCGASRAVSLLGQAL
jgi:hypothetical protein